MAGGGKDEKRKKDRQKADEDVVLVEDKLIVPTDPKTKGKDAAKKKKKDEKKKKGGGLSGFFGFGGKDKKDKDKKKKKHKGSKGKDKKKEKDAKPAKHHSAEEIPTKKPKKDQKHRKSEPVPTITGPTSSGQTLSIDNAALPKKPADSNDKKPKKAKDGKHKPHKEPGKKSKGSLKKGGSQEAVGSKAKSSEAIQPVKPDKKAKKHSTEKKESRSQPIESLAKGSKEGPGSGLQQKRSESSDSMKNPFATDPKHSGSENAKQSGSDKAKPEEAKHSKENKSGSNSGKVFNDVAVGSAELKAKKTPEKSSPHTYPISDRFPLGKSVHLTASPPKQKKKSSRKITKASSMESVTSAPSTFTRPSSAESTVMSAQNGPGRTPRRIKASTTKRTASAESIPLPKKKHKKEKAQKMPILAPVPKKSRSNDGTSEANCSMNGSPRLQADKTPPSSQGAKQENSDQKAYPEGKLVPDSTPPASPQEQKLWADEIERKKKKSSHRKKARMLRPDATPPSSPLEKKLRADEGHHKKKSSHGRKVRMLPPDATPPSSPLEKLLVDQVQHKKKKSSHGRNAKMIPADSTPPSSGERLSAESDHNTQKSTPRPEPTESTQISTKPRSILSLNVDEVIKIGGVLERHGMEPDRKKAFEWIAANRDLVDIDRETAAHNLLTAVGDLPMSKELVQQTLKFMVTREIITKEEYKKHFKKLAIDVNNPMTVVQLSQLLTVYVDAYKHSASMERA